MRTTENINNEASNFDLFKELWDKVTNYFSNKSEEELEREKIEEENRSFIHLVDRAKADWDRAKNYFEEVSNPDLIDLAIYRMEAARIFYMYLLKEAKRRGISA